MGILDIVREQDEDRKDIPKAHIIVPAEGFCVKLKTANKEKVFVNICQSDKVPLPRDISEDELRELLEDIEGSPPFKIPMSIGEPHAELDAAGKGCTAYDVIIHPEFLKKVRSSDLFETFLMTVVVEGLESKYDTHLERNWIVLKNKKAMGRLQEQYVRASSRPAIVEMDDPIPSLKTNLIEEVEHPVVSEERLSGENPVYKLSTVPEDGKPEYLVAEIQLPKLRSSRGLYLDVGSDLLCLTSRSHTYAMETLLDPPVDEQTTVAEFNRDTKVLRVTMPMLKKAAPS
ncbi:unnamed protein product [Calicophoron daubneyi]|uniref:PIH1 domain-containing protein 1 n=1 Tax=Calicophoron daubneyi TaxID=300641 RepID=A0AAV2T9U2_CALDB